MDTLKIGQIINQPQQRDAVHMAIVPMEAGERLQAGLHVGLLDGKAVITDARRVLRRGLKAVGIVDPFLTVDVQKGDKFWLFLYPGSITSLRHDWTHPAFGAVEGTQEFSAKQLSETWLRDFCDREGINYSYLRDHESVGDREDLCDSLGDNKEFARHWAVVMGKECPDYFSCAC